MYRTNGIERSNYLEMRTPGKVSQSCCHFSWNLKDETVFSKLVMKSNGGLTVIF